MPEGLADAAKRLALGLAVLVSVDLQRDGQPWVAEDDLRVAGRDAKVLSRVAVVCRRWWTLMSRSL